MFKYNKIEGMDKFIWILVKVNLQSLMVSAVRLTVKALKSQFVFNLSIEMPKRIKPGL